MRKKTMEPIAIVGLAFRLPGDIASESQLWQMLKQGRELITDVVDERWSVSSLLSSRYKEPGKAYSFAAGLLSGIEQFDAQFFGISPREARQMDPRQRLLLEVTWDALEHGGQIPSELHGSDCGVYIGVSGNDYSQAFASDPAMIETHTTTGNACSIASNRLSYALGLTGPSLSVDTACSSALVALDLACKALWAGDISTAIAGCASMHLHPLPFVGFSKAQMLSKSGHCKAFDEAGDGYVRSEGCISLFLKPLSQALKDNDPIQALIVNTGVNSDGQTSSMPVPSSEAQAELIHAVHSEVGVSAEQIAYIEAHGTGTPVGDPIEAAALGASLGQRRATPLPIGSVKSNLGHLEVASGMAGLLKVIQCLKHQAIPPSLHFATPNKQIDFANLNLSVVADYQTVTSDEPLLMGVNCFGFGGTNAHVLVQQYVAPKTTHGKADTASLTPPLFISAKSPEALKAKVAQMHDFLTAENYYASAYHLAFKREGLDYGVAFSGDEVSRLKQRLTDYCAQRMDSSFVVTTKRYKATATAALVFSGNGCQWLGMGRQLMAQCPQFAAHVNEVFALFRAHSELDLLGAFYAEADNDCLNFTEYAQPLLFAVQVGLTHYLLDKGVTFSAVMGHSVGEVAAAYASGALTLSAAVTLVYARSSVQATTKGQGRMAAVGLSVTACRDIFAELDVSLEIAGINSRNSLTVAGTETALLQLSAYCEKKQVFFKLLALDYPFHSVAMTPLKTAFFDALGQCAPQATHTPFISSVTGLALSGEQLTADYWWQNISEPVQFQAALITAVESGVTHFIELGPSPIMSSYIVDALKSKETKGHAFYSLKQGLDEVRRLEHLCLELALSGATLNKHHWFSAIPKAIELPAYPFQRQAYWYKPTTENKNHCTFLVEHPLLGARVELNGHVWENHLSIASHPWLNHHQVEGNVVLPAAAMMEMALAVATLLFDTKETVLTDFEVHLPLVFEEDCSRTVRFEYHANTRRFVILSKPRLSAEPFAQHAIGRISTECPVLSKPTVECCVENAKFSVGSEEHLALAASVGLHYGPSFQWLAQVHVFDAHAIGGLTKTLQQTLTIEDYHVFPGLLDAGLQVLISGCREDILNGTDSVFLPFRTESIRLSGDILQARSVRCDFIHRGSRSLLMDVYFLDADGFCLLTLMGCRLRAMRLSMHASSATFVDCVKVLDGPLKPVPFMDIDALSSLATKVEQTLVSRSQFFEEMQPLLEALVCQYVFEAVSELSTNNAFTLSELAIANNAMPFFKWCLALLADEGLLQNEGTLYQLLPANEPISSLDLSLAILGEYPQLIAELIRVSRIGQRLPALFCGETRLQIPTAIDAMYLTTSPTIAGRLALIEKCMAQLVACVPANRRLTILQVGGSENLLPLLQPILATVAYDYCLSHSDEAILAGFEGRFLTSSAVTTIPLEWSAESAPLQQYDIVIVAGELHCQPSLLACLSRLKKQLHADGVLLLAERTPNRVDDFCNGANHDWWRYASEKKISGQLLTATLWRQLLVENGFVVTQPVEESTADALQGEFVIMAQALTVSDSHVASTLFHCLALVDQAITAEHLRAIDEKISFTTLTAGDDFALTDKSSLDAALKTAYEEQPFSQLVFMLGLSQESESFDHVTAALHLAQVLPPIATVPVTFVTRGGAPCKDNPCINPQAASLWGFVRVLMNESPVLQPCLIDCQSVSIENIASLVVDSLRQTSTRSTNEWLYDEHTRYRLAYQPADTLDESFAESTDIYLDFKTAGRLSHLEWMALKERPLASDEIAIRPQAVGLNFRDVMYTMGMIADEALEQGFLGANLGMEFAGDIIAIGGNVVDVSVGQSVMGFAAACFSSRIIVKAATVVTVPSGWSYQQAATVPIVFFTAFYALNQLAQLDTAERVLIHGAAGGVGIAAIQLAHCQGAEVYATAGSQEKRDFLRLMGVKHIYDSRSLAFAEGILNDTDGEGVDVVLNCLSGEAIDVSMRLLRPFGRFLELGKRDFYENNLLSLRPFRNNISYFGIDADQLMIERSALTRRLFQSMMALFADGELRPLPFRSFPAKDIHAAFKCMQKSEQIGKIVVDMNVLPSVPALPAKQRLTLNPAASYLVTGGLSGFGLKTAEFLIDRGAKKLILLSRKAQLTSEAIKVIDALQDKGGEVFLRSVDVSDKAAVEAVICEFKASLKGIFHSAVVFDDAMINDLDNGRLAAVLAPKCLGAKHLHLASVHLELDYFVLYSSATTVIGNPGQANYVAANAYLEALAKQRRQQSLPGQFIAWGAIADVGFLARNEKVKAMLEATTGAKAMDSKDALNILEQCLLAKRTGFSVMDYNVASLSHLLPDVNQAKFSLLHRLSSTVSAGGGDELSHILATKSPEEVAQFVKETLSFEVAQILSISPKLIDVSQSLSNMGMDSLMGVELARAIEQRFKVTIPLMSLSQGGSIDAITKKVVTQLLQTEKGGSQVAKGEVYEFMAASRKHGLDEALNEQAASELLTAVNQALAPIESVSNDE